MKRVLFCLSCLIPLAAAHAEVTVPEPATWSPLVIGLAAIVTFACVRRRVRS
jgi:PEP-CTERM motif-containing protein